MLTIFLQFELGKIIKYFRTKTTAKIVTSLLFFIVFFIVASGIYYFFIGGFRYINAESTEDIRLALTLFLYEVFLLILSGVIIFSSMISGLFNLFRSDHNDWILSSPQYKIFPKIVLIRGIVGSSLPSLIMFIPAILAFNKVNNLTSISIFFILFSVLVLLALLNTITSLMITFVGFIYYKISQSIQKIRFTFGGLVSILFICISTITVMTWQIVTRVDVANLFAQDAEGDILNISTISTHFNFLPTHHFAMEIINWQIGNTTIAIINFLIFIAVTLLALFIWMYISPLFYPLWQKFQEGTPRTNTTKEDTVSKSLIDYKFTGSKTLVLFKKEVLISSRNWKGILWFSFLLFIWIMQIATSFLLDNNLQRHQSDIGHKIAMLQSLEFIIAIYFMSSFTLRFVFPSFSAERKTSWILASAPLSFAKIFFGKYIFYTVFFVILGILMNYINGNVLNLSLSHTFYSTLLLVSNIVFIVTLSLSLGAIFPSTETDNPEAISTSMPGLFFTALSLMYGALSAFILYRSLLEKSVPWLMLFVLVTLLASVIILIKTPAIIKGKLLN